MKKTQAKPGKLTFVAKPANPASEIDFLELRRQIKNRVGEEAISMVEATIEAVNNGQYAALKYLFEAVGLFPIDLQDSRQQPDGLAPALLRALKLPQPEDPAPTASMDSQ